MKLFYKNYIPVVGCTISFLKKILNRHPAFKVKSPNLKKIKHLIYIAYYQIMIFIQQNVYFINIIWNHNKVADIYSLKCYINQKKMNCLLKYSVIKA